MAADTIDLTKFLEEQQATAGKLSTAADTGSARVITKGAASALGDNLVQTQETIRQISVDNILNVHRSNVLTNQSVEAKVSELEFTARVNEDVNIKNQGISNAMGAETIKIGEIAQQLQSEVINRPKFWQSPIKNIVGGFRVDYLRGQLEQHGEILSVLNGTYQANRDLGNQAIDEYQATTATRTAAELTQGAAAAKADYEARAAITSGARAGQENLRRGALDLVGVAGDLEKQATRAAAEREKNIQLYTPQVNAILRGTGVNPANATESQRMGALSYYNALDPKGQQAMTTVAAAIDRSVRAGGVPSDSVILQTLGTEATLDGVQSYVALTGNKEMGALIETGQQATYNEAYTNALRQAAIDSLPTSGLAKGQLEQQIGMIRAMPLAQLVNQKIITAEQRKVAQQQAAQAAQNLTSNAFKSLTKKLIEEGDGLTPGMKLNYNGTDFNGVGWDKQTLTSWGIPENVQAVILSPEVQDQLKAKPVVQATGLGDKMVMLREKMKAAGVPDDQMITGLSRLADRTAYSKAAGANKGRVASYEALNPGDLKGQAVVPSPALQTSGMMQRIGGDPNKTLNLADPLDLREFYARFDKTSREFQGQAQQFQRAAPLAFPQSSPLVD